MKLGQHDAPLHLTYCLNVHAGETWETCFENIKTKASEVRRQVAPDVPFGLGLRVGHAASRTLAQPEALAYFKAFLDANNLYVFTVNGFPYGPFHGTPVKERVYAPDWRTPERLDYTRQLADILCALLPPGVDGSISTVPGSYKAWITSDADVEAMVANLMVVVDHLAMLHAKTGRELHLGLEPEPDCFIETTAETVAFFTQTLPRWGYPALAHRRGCTRAAAAALVQRHLGVCFDTCHLLVQFEDIAASLAALTAHAVRISKVQVSAALHARCDAATRAALGAFCDPVYLHQVRGQQSDGSVVPRGDLDQALAAPDPGDATWRVHCHVPLYFEGDASITSTADALTPAFFDNAIAAGATHFEIETYTFDVLPAPLRALGITASIAREFQWVTARLPVAT